ncbi:class I adenylate-forming enzyme family protein [Streptomyces sp. NPDC002588]|uniref:class I adenylate-forming enzyme family protein n=1 Tax=Streptomyces sp. NPDC002588 TaxID=3154419 RepID=UPI00331A28C6
MTNVAGFLDRAAHDHGSRPAVRDRTGTWTWAELDRASRLAAHRLKERGIGPGQRVLSTLAADRGFFALLFGVLRVGATLIPAGEATSDYELAWLLTDAEPAVLVASPDRPALPEASKIPVTRLSELLTGLDHRDAVRFPDAVAPDTHALLLYTSGSTGRPKGVVCRHDAVAFAAEAIASRLRYQQGDVVWNRLPVSFDYGLYQIFLCALAGAELVLPAAELSASELVSVRDAGATVVPLVPTLAALLARLAERDRRPTAVRMFSNTGAALAAPAARRLRSAFPGTALVQMYGMTECKRVTIADPDEDLVYPGAVGRALPGTRLFVVDEEGRPLSAGNTGQIVAAGPHVMSGYWRSPAATAERFGTAPDGAGPAVFTGDRGYLDTEGRLYWTGRDDDIFKRRGRRTSVQEVESAMLDIAEVEAAAVLPPGPDEVLTVWAVTTLEPKQVLRSVAVRLGAARTPDRCVVVAELPRTAHGKVDRAALRASLAAAR